MAWIDPTPTSINSLDPKIRPAAVALVNGLRQAGVPVFIQASGARRTTDEQQRLVQSGRSQTYRSKHLLGLAFDIDIRGFRREEIPKWFWDELGPAAEAYLGLRWGGRFKSLYDPGHFEIG